MHRIPPNTKEKFFSNVLKTDDRWIWQGSVNDSGYGLTCVFNKSIRAHRLSYLFQNGELPDDLCVLHKCDNPPCVNPAHLRLGTKKENTRDMVSKRRNAMCSVLNAEKVKEIKELYKTEKNRAKIGRLFGVTKHTIENIVKGRTWAHLE